MRAHVSDTLYLPPKKTNRFPLRSCNAMGEQILMDSIMTLYLIVMLCKCQSRMDGVQYQLSCMFALQTLLEAMDFSLTQINIVQVDFP